MRPTVYVETTIPSYYCDGRVDLRLDIARTRTWWDEERGDYICFVSPVVLEELSAGTYGGQDCCLELMRDLPVLEITADVISIARAYQEERLMPKSPAADALHLAVASWYRMDYLLTWNCRHLANANKLRHVEALNLRLRVGVPLIVTPHQLQRWERDE